MRARRIYSYILFSEQFNWILFNNQQQVCYSFTIIIKLHTFFPFKKLNDLALNVIEHIYYATFFTPKKVLLSNAWLVLIHKRKKHFIHAFVKCGTPSINASPNATGKSILNHVANPIRVQKAYHSIVCVEPASSSNHLLPSFRHPLVSKALYRDLTSNIHTYVWHANEM